MGSGTTLKVAHELGRKCVGYEIDLELSGVIKGKLGFNQPNLFGQKLSDFIEIIVRENTKHLRTKLQATVRKKPTR